MRENEKLIHTLEHRMQILFVGMWSESLSLSIARQIMQSESQVQSVFLFCWPAILFCSVLAIYGLHFSELISSSYFQWSGKIFLATLPCFVSLYEKGKPGLRKEMSSLWLFSFHQAICLCSSFRECQSVNILDWPISRLLVASRRIVNNLGPIAHLHWKSVRSNKETPTSMIWKTIDEFTSYVSGKYLSKKKNRLWRWDARKYRSRLDLV